MLLEKSKPDYDDIYKRFSSQFYTLLLHYIKAFSIVSTRNLHTFPTKFFNVILKVYAVISHLPSSLLNYTGT